MKNALLITNAILVIAVAILFYLQFSNKNKSATTIRANNTEGRSVSNQCSIAYFEMDSVTNSFSMVKDVKADLTKEEDQMNNELNRFQKLYNDRLAQYQKQGQTMSQIESERANRDMMQLQETIRGKKQQMDQKYQDLYMRKMQDVKGKIEEYLKEYNKNKGYSYILAYEPGIIYYRDSIYNITGDLVKGLNDQYSKNKK